MDSIKALLSHLVCPLLVVDHLRRVVLHLGELVSKCLSPRIELHVDAAAEVDQLQARTEPGLVQEGLDVGGEGVRAGPRKAQDIRKALSISPM